MEYINTKAHESANIKFVTSEPKSFSHPEQWEQKQKGVSIMTYLQKAMAKATELITISASRGRQLSSSNMIFDFNIYSTVPGYLILIIASVLNNEGGYSSWGLWGSSRSPEQGNGIYLISPKNQSVFEKVVKTFLSSQLTPVPVTDSFYKSVVEKYPQYAGFFLYIHNTNFGLAATGGVLQTISDAIKNGMYNFITWDSLNKAGVVSIHKNGDLINSMSELYFKHDIAFYYTFHHYVLYKLKMAAAFNNSNLLLVYLRNGISKVNVMKTAVLIDKSFHLQKFSRYFDKITGDTKDEISQSCSVILAKAGSDRITKTNEATVKVYTDRTSKTLDFIDKYYGQLVEDSSLTAGQSQNMGTLLSKKNYTEKLGNNRSIKEA